MSGCGYQPSAQYSKKVLNGSVFVEVVVNRIEPENAPYLTDEMRRIVVNRFENRVSTKEEATNKIKAEYNNISFIPLAYDKNGYVTSYKTTIGVDFTLVDRSGKIVQKRITSSTFDRASTDSLQSTALKQASIKRVLEQVADEFIAYIGTIGVSK